MSDDDYEHFVGSVSEQLTLMLWVAFATVGTVSIIIFLALR